MKPSPCSWPSGAENPASPPRVSAAQAAAAEQQGNTFLSPLQAPRQLSGGERQRGGTLQLGQREASPEFSEAEQRTDTLSEGRRSAQSVTAYSCARFVKGRSGPEDRSDDLCRPQRSARLLRGIMGGRPVAT